MNYWDIQTGLYYLQSRYYDPQVGRFINADEPTNLFYTADTVGGANLYSYALNNPIMYFDPTGEVVWFIPVLIGVGKVLFTAAAIAGTAYAVYSFATDPSLENGIALAVDIGLTLAGVKIFKMVDKYLDARKIAKANKAMDDIIKNPQLIKSYTIKKFDKIAKNASDWTYQAARNGKGMRLTNNLNKSLQIRYGYGINNAMHNNGGYYWRIATGRGPTEILF